MARATVRNGLLRPGGRVGAREAAERGDRIFQYVDHLAPGRAIRDHLQPVFGNSPMRSITLTVVLEMVATQLADGKPKSSIKLCFELLDAILAAAVTDRLIPDNPCSGVRLSKVLSGVSRVPKWIPKRG